MFRFECLFLMINMSLPRYDISHWVYSEICDWLDHLNLLIYAFFSFSTVTINFCLWLFFLNQKLNLTFSTDFVKNQSKSCNFRQKSKINDRVSLSASLIYGWFSWFNPYRPGVETWTESWTLQTAWKQRWSVFATTKSRLYHQLFTR